MVMNAFDTNFDGENEVYALNTVAFAYMNEPIRINAGELQRAHVINITEFDPINSIHLHANFFSLYRTGTSLQPDNGRGMARPDERSRGFGAAGLVTGFLVMYATGLLT